MSLKKVDYIDQETIITAENMNDIQDAVIELESAVEQIETKIVQATVE